MTVLNSALYFVIETLLGLLSIALLLRFYLQLTNVPFHNPVSQAVIKVTAFAVRPARRVIPSWRGLDISTILLAYIAQLLLRVAGLLLDGYPILVATLHVYLAILGLALVSVVKVSAYIFLYATVIQAVLSWIQPYSPAAPVLDRLTHPVLAPIRRVLKNTGGIDFSPLVAFLLIQVAMMVLLGPIERQLAVLL